MSRVRSWVNQRSIPLAIDVPAQLELAATAPRVQLRVGHRQIGTTPPPLARVVTPVIAWSCGGALGVQPLGVAQGGGMSQPLPVHAGAQSLRNRASDSSRFYDEKESLAVISVQDESLSGVIGNVGHDARKTVQDG